MVHRRSSYSSANSNTDANAIANASSYIDTNDDDLQRVLGHAMSRLIHRHYVC